MKIPNANVCNEVAIACPTHVQTQILYGPNLSAAIAITLTMFNYAYMYMRLCIFI